MMKSCDSCHAVWEGGQPSTCTCDFDPSCGAAAVPVTITGQLQALRCIEALTELVRLKRMKERTAYLGARPVSETGEEYVRLRDEYEAGKDKAWQAAFDALESK